MALSRNFRQPRAPGASCVPKVPEFRPAGAPRRSGPVAEGHLGPSGALSRPRENAGGRRGDPLDGPRHSFTNQRRSPSGAILDGSGRVVRHLALRGRIGIPRSAAGAVSPTQVAGSLALDQLHRDPARSAERGIMDPRVLPAISAQGEPLTP